MNKIFVLLGPIGIIFIWFFVTTTGVIKPIFLPSPQAVFIELISSTLTGEILINLFPTLYRWFIGVVIGFILGIPLGLLMGYSDNIYRILEVPVDFFRSIPAMTIFPLFLVFFGLGDKSKIAVSAWASFLFILINTLYGVRHSKELRLMVARVLNASRMQTFYKIIFPSSLPEIFVGIRIALSISLIVVVASEMIMGTKYGLGKKIIDSALIYEMSTMYSYIIVTGLLGYISNKLFVLIERLSVHWAGK